MLTEFQLSFYKRINVEPILNLKFEDLFLILDACCSTFSFENLDVIQDDIKEVTKETIYNQIVLNENGGLCFKLNGLIYYFLQESGFKDISLVTGVVVSGPNPNRAAGAHVAIILVNENKKYYIDIGFGGFTPILPIQIDEVEEITKSKNGLFRIVKEENEAINYLGKKQYYTHKMQFKKEDDYIDENLKQWISTFFFNLEPLQESYLNTSQKIMIIEKIDLAIGPMVFKFIDGGVATLTRNYLTITTNNGKKTKNPIHSNDHFNEILKSIFNINNQLIFSNKNKNVEWD
ncbi:hypothetical protein DICPUDRAFT_33247 [Dictyostelium purpureum]|uniref:arylamine N-acetyltransferase n=1 Tax=Dictyostelium purpureum TaxID=5786 RepID=F0ZKG5_DICPU|nr:uncharacterized protein DICPUDRAFT_33247 [Dictyostelium purpureum]EGC35538.1 hypothetical protein DICPUDRAFT_33247 [Dictyostelium purpureum]|eukprot:XP_003287909.1 hypothetical protein DICPUDRAFT_33247 [Dictyostelium purpureum]